MPIYVNPQTSFFDKSFKNNSFPSFFLSIQISLNGIVLSVYDSEKNKIIGLESFRLVGLTDENQITEELDSLIKEREWITEKFRKVYVVLSNPISTLVPQALFEKNKKDLYMDFNQPVGEDTITDFNLLKNAAAANLFLIPKLLDEKIKSLWPGVVLFHSSSIFIESILINYKNKADNNMLFVNVNHDFFEVVYIKNNKLFFHNTFHFRAKEDFIYFLLSVIEQLKLNPEEVKIILSGSIDRSSIYYEMVYQYIRHNEFIEKNETFNYSYIFDKLAHHKYYILFNILQCV